jgi:minor extracellular serine protease Vpr
VPADNRGVTWDFVTGSSAASAYTAGVAATVLSKRDLSSTEVRSAIATTTQPLTDSLLAGGAGRVRAAESAAPGLVHPLDADTYRPWLEGRRTDLNTPSIVLRGGQNTASRRVTNVAQRSRYFSSRVVGLRGKVRVTPAALRLDPGETARYRVTVTGGRRGGSLDEGYVVWRGATGTVTRVPILFAR